MQNTRMQIAISGMTEDANRQAIFLADGFDAADRFWNRRARQADIFGQLVWTPPR